MSDKKYVDEAELIWKLHVPNLLIEILKNKGTEVLLRPLQLLARKLENVATRASQLNDPILNGLMCEMALYSIADPVQKNNYDPDKVKEIFAQALKEKKKAIE